MVRPTSGRPPRSGPKDKDRPTPSKAGTKRDVDVLPARRSNGFAQNLGLKRTGKVSLRGIVAFPMWFATSKPAGSARLLVRQRLAGQESGHSEDMENLAPRRKERQEGNETRDDRKRSYRDRA